MPASTTSNEFQPKLIYLARRHPRLSRPQFTQRWRQHGALGMSLPRWRNIARYVHCDVLEPTPPTTAVATDHDAIGLIWHRSVAARVAHLADGGSRQAMEQDEAETFARPIVESCLVAREIVLLAPPATASIKLTRFLASDRADQSPDHGGRGTAITLQQEDSAARLRAALGAAGAAPLGHVIDLPLPPERGDRWGLDCGAVEELWFHDVAAALRAADLIGRTAAQTGARTFLGSEVVLYAT